MQWRFFLYRLKRVYHFVKTALVQAVPAIIQANFPQKNLFIIAITGTDGKTTTSTLVHHILTQAGVKAGLITTLGAKIGDKQIETGLHVTNPNPQLLYQILKKMVDQECTHLVIEMTSHGAYQFRNFGLTPQVGAITNISHEHFDYHLNYREYVLAKASLFRHTPKVWINQDDTSFPMLKKLLKQKTVMFSSKSPLPKNIHQAILTRFTQQYNQLNGILSALIALELKVEPKIIAQAIKQFSQLTGRMQSIPNQRKINLIVDFAHTPKAVEATLASLKTTRTRKNAKIIAVLGAAGQRDVSKRPIMGSIAATYADLVIFTAEDPRIENVWTIIGQLKSQLGKNHHKVVSIADRGNAIFYAINHLAKAGDTVIIMGKGHEKSLCYGEKEYSWSDVSAAEQALNKQMPVLGPLIS